MHITTFLAVLKTWNFSGKSGKNFGHGTDLEKKSMEKKRCPPPGKIPGYAYAIEQDKIGPKVRVLEWF